MNHIFTRFVLALSIIFTSQFAFAQTVTDTVEMEVSTCTALTYGMSLGSRDSRTKGQVSDLQAYLQAGGYLSGDPTGYFGALTKKAVQKFQSANGITSNGLVGPYTRAKIKEVSCGMDNDGNVLAGVVAEAKWNTPANNGGTISVSLSNIPTSQEISSYKFSVLCAGVSLPRNGGDLCGTSESLRNLNIGSFSFDFPYTNKGISSKRGIEAKLTALNSSGKVIGSIQKSLYPPTSVTETSSPVPLLSVISVPELKLEYSPEGGEAVLVASYTVNVVAGDKAVSASALSGGSPAGIVLKKANGEAANVSVTLSADGPTIVQPGNSAVYRVNGRVDPKKLFAGAYYMEMIPVLYTVGPANQWVATEVKPLGSTATNYRIVLGEVSPYITKIVCDSTPTVNCTVHGVRFDPEGNSVTVNGVTKTLPSLNGGTSISFIASDFGITTAGTYYTQVSARRGASNGHMATVGAPTQNGSVPVVEFLDTPTLRLGYDGQGKETMLIGKVTMKVTTGNSPIRMYRTSAPSVLQFTNSSSQPVTSNSALFMANATGVTLGSSLDTIQANSIATFNVVNTMKASELFAGSYRMKPANFYYIDNSNGGNEVQHSSFKNVDSSNSVTIVGETSPFISIAVVENGAIVVKGARLDLPGNSVLIDGVKRDMGASVTSTSISIPTQVNGIGSGGHFIQVINSTTGDSNRAYVTVEGSVTPLPKPVTDLSSSPASSGGTLLTWSSKNATKCELSSGSVGEGRTEAPLFGSKTLDFMQPTRKVTLTCSSADGSTSDKSLTVYGYSFTNTAAMVLKMSVGSVPLDLSYDLNKDGRVTSADALAYQATTIIPAALTNSDKSLIAMRMSVGTAPIDLSYDLNKDGKVTSADGLLFLNLDSSAPAPTTTQTTTVTTQSADSTPPGFNAMSCSRTSATNAGIGSVACYGIWDDGRSFGEDQNMCGGYSFAGGTGCVISTPVCSSGRATATKAYVISSASQADIAQIALNLNTTSAAVTKYMLKTWVYTCTDSTTSSSGGVVQGVSTMCVGLSYNMHRGNETPNVKKLQSFLVEQGLLEEVTGFFGDKTVTAVKEYQTSKGLPATGMVYDFTRSAIAAETCR